MPKDYREYTEKELKELIAKVHNVPPINVTLIHHLGSDPDVDDRHSKPPSVSVRVLVKS